MHLVNNDTAPPQETQPSATDASSLLSMFHHLTELMHSVGDTYSAMIKNAAVVSKGKTFVVNIHFDFNIIAL